MLNAAHDKTYIINHSLLKRRHKRFLGDKMKNIISKLKARKILDSRGNPTIEVEVGIAGGKPELIYGRAAAPSGASRGKSEVVDFPDGGVDAAIEKVEKLLPGLTGIDAFDQEKIDITLREMDGTPNLAEIGGNTTVAISMAAAKAAAAAKGLPLFQYLGGERAYELPCPLGNIIGGGKHAGRIAPDIQEILVVAVGAKNFLDAFIANTKVHKKVRKLVGQVDKTFTGGKGDEGAWAPNMENEVAIDLVKKACEEIGGEVDFEIKPALDVAASSFYNEEKDNYIYNRDSMTRDRGEQLDFIASLIKKYDLFYVEDPIQEEDFEGFAELTEKFGGDCLICGDDLFVTNVERIAKGIESKSANAVLIKPNQIGTLTDTLRAVELAKKNKYTPVMSHRSGETPDETIAHLTVAWGCPMIKTGVVGGERIAKLNELIRIEEGLSGRARMGRLR